MRRPGLVVLALLLAPPLWAQGWRLGLDLREQATSYRGWRIDSIPVSDTVSGSNGNVESPDGYVVRCDGGPVCRYWRPGAVRRGLPTLLTADGAAWGLGVPGLSLHGRARVGGDLANSDPWYGPDRTLELVEGYADLDRDRWSARAGRQVVQGRLGWWGVDGARVWWRPSPSHLEFSTYGGWGLARSSDLTATSSALDPLGDFQTARRQRAVGGTGRWSVAHGSLEAAYHREWSGVDGGVTVERAAFGLERLLGRGVAVNGGATYDLASGLWGSWDAGATGARGRLVASARIRQYRPLFDLFSIWQAFSPTPYHAIEGSAGYRIDQAWAVRASAERYWFGETGALSALVTVGHTGWRAATGVTWSPAPPLTIDGEVRREFGVGALANAVQGSAHWAPGAAWSLLAAAGHLERPLEYRADVSTLNWISVGAERRWTERLGAGVTIDHWAEDRARPDAAAVAWDQFRLATFLRWRFGSDADHLPLPPATGRRGW